MEIVSIVVVLTIIYVIYKSNKLNIKSKAIGNSGEAEISYILNNMNISGNVFNNLYYTFNNGKITEIDLVFVTDRKIYVIESKNYSGSIIGDEANTYWITQYSNRTQYKMYNPIMQNRTHVNAINDLIKASSPDLIESLIVFGNKADISQVKHSGKCMNTRDLEKYITQSYNTSKVRFNTSEFRQLVTMIGSLTGASKYKKSKHLQQINRKHK